ncbi:cytochrome P450 [Irpex rosettiformis]|uniref:Cytochrome P450 n=1 Tax=Irpex rosettiformis TaxID=378272 RepID=A0ACB8TXL5_9APHY|nr:cytochrome P450 [Irpex rosettiformis]
MEVSNPGLLIAIPLIALAYVTLNRWNRSPGPLPPIPAGKLPILGHLLQMPQSHEWLKYLEWSDQTGSDILCYQVLNSHVIVLNSFKAVSELFEGRTSIYSNRPTLLALRHILGFHWVLGLMPYGKQFLEVRKASNHYLHNASIKKYRPIQTVAIHSMLRGLHREPEKFVEHARHMAGRIILNVTYGIEPNPTYIRTVYHSVLGLGLGLSPRALLHDMFPFLLKLPEWFPLFRFKADAKKFSPYVAALPDLPLDETRKAMAEGTARPSMAASMLADGGLPDSIIRSVTGSLYLAGTETTVATITNFFLAMLKYPDVQHKARSEIDSVVGPNRLPDFRDEPNLPYLSALIKELYRWRVVTPLGTPHSLIVDDVYRGYHFPKDSIVISNLHAIMHDPVAFPEPNVFRPERYLEDAGKPTSTRSSDGVFGYGGRVCPGRYLTKSNTWLAVASILATFDIEKATDEDGCVIEPDDVGATSGVVSFPLPFKCKITPRSEAAAALIAGTADEEVVIPLP